MLKQLTIAGFGNCNVLPEDVIPEMVGKSACFKLKILYNVSAI
jgi:hypothetical protein